MKAVVVSFALLLGSSSLVFAHNTRSTNQTPATTANAVVAGWRYAVPDLQIDRKEDGAAQTLTGGPSGEPGQS